MGDRLGIPGVAAVLRVPERIVLLQTHGQQENRNTQNAQICAPNRGPFARVCTRNRRITHHAQPHTHPFLSKPDHTTRTRVPVGMCTRLCISRLSNRTACAILFRTCPHYLRVRSLAFGHMISVRNQCTRTHTHTTPPTTQHNRRLTHTREPIAETLCGPRFVRACWTRRMRRRATDRLSGSKRTACHIEINQPGCLTAREPKCLTYCLLPVCLSISCLPDCLHVGTISTAC
ncbi:hypothetical protein AHF37_09403 [Paragonimus kellicotti]|nr:hypothetical protein AHF37_09403 [Paragonimus kellicotti]